MLYFVPYSNVDNDITGKYTHTHAHTKSDNSKKKSAGMFEHVGIFLFVFNEKSNQICCIRHICTCGEMNQFSFFDAWMLVKIW